MSARPVSDDPRMHAGIDMLRRTGLRSFQLRYSDDEQPVIWLAVGEWGVDESGRPVKSGGETRHDTASALRPVDAVLRLLEQTLDGGECAHCNRPTGVFPELVPPKPPQILEAAVCWYVFDAKSERFVSGCKWEGS